MRTRVLIADDENQVLDSLTKLLESAGYAVMGRAQTGREVCRLTSELAPDAVLLDIKMPDMDGLEAAQAIMNATPVPIVLCTGYCDEELIRRAADAGVYAYITKPFRVAEITAAIALAIRRHADARDLKNEVGRLGDALEARKLIEKAKGIVMRTQGIGEDQAHRYLQTESQQRSQPIVELAKAILTADEMSKVQAIGDGTERR